MTSSLAALVSAWTEAGVVIRSVRILRDGRAKITVERGPIPDAWASVGGLLDGWTIRPQRARWALYRRLS